MDLSLFSDIKSSINKEAKSQPSSKANRPSKKDTNNPAKKRKEEKERAPSDGKTNKKEQKSVEQRQTKKVKKEDETLLKDILELGGSKKDLELIDDAGSDEEIDPRQENNKSSKAGDNVDPNLLQDLSKFASQLGFAQNKFDERAYDSESDEDRSSEESSVSPDSDVEVSGQEDDASDQESDDDKAEKK
ncbi:hypothetical protein SPOG_03881 [Schizosaccharomyces cryophilus OY26]|uniref:Uncharacterized protein n=1 Tax=Schizosaccharomyces cryophilus (strain OY26 / ATCC MYA-4695 / CBS 11777 / NBRC 106824 / NRRL Y48691) TaxID=653667 RepID=S9W4D0_SCHCR|nr:uncharacterized protein SPOG_03881 [Schizosaccharomyces cryophilus OY26]EPY53354.1 hypothetical protein SPOG_03881 [Schizosaccharomyces cryophilus OY26]